VSKRQVAIAKRVERLRASIGEAQKGLRTWICRECPNEFRAFVRPRVCAGCGGRKLIRLAEES
jgi:rubrerythrin